MSATRLPLAVVEFEGVRWPWLWAILLIAGAAILFVAYREIFLRTERRLTWGLMGLRTVGLLFLVLALAKPTWTRESEEVDAGRVAVIFDNSRSMSLADEGGGTRYARARTALDRFTQALHARGGPRLAVDLFDIEGNPLEKVPDSPTVDRTDLGKALRQATGKLRSRSLAGVSLAGVVLISDGM